MSAFRSSYNEYNDMSPQAEEYTSKYIRTDQKPIFYQEDGPSAHNIYSLQQDGMFSVPRGLGDTGGIGASGTNPNCNSNPTSTALGWYIGGGVSTIILIIGIITAFVKIEDKPWLFLLLAIVLGLSLAVIAFGVLLQMFLTNGTVFNYCVPINQACEIIYKVAFSGYYVILILLFALFVILSIFGLIYSWNRPIMFLLGFLATIVGILIFFLSIIQTYIANGTIFGYQTCNTCTPSS